jgi:hypothetical protein
MKKTIKQISLGIIMTLSCSNIAMADQGLEQRNITWFSSTTSGLLDRSSVELATNHVMRGIHYAYSALQHKLSPTDELIANHNLCIGYLTLNDLALSTQYCVRAFKLAQEPYRVVKIRGSFRLQENNVDDDVRTTLTATQMVVTNILQRNSQIRFTLLVN